MNDEITLRRALVERINELERELLLQIQANKLLHDRLSKYEPPPQVDPKLIIRGKNLLEPQG